MQHMPDYLRISVTDRCNLRCIYCMPPEGVPYTSHDNILRFEEIERLVRIFCSLGVRKVRLTGGEPLVRKGLVSLVRKLNNIPLVDELCLTTNGMLLSAYADELRDAGIRKVNISIDTLKSDRFKKITGGHAIRNVLEGIRAARDASFYSVKINTVVMNEVNTDEIFDFIEFSCLHGIPVRFIEFMACTSVWNKKYFIPIEDVIAAAGKKYLLKKLGSINRSAAVYYRVGEDGLIGFIKTDESTCACCSRLRLTSTGELKICLYESQGINLRDMMRSGRSDGEIAAHISARSGLKQQTNFKNFTTPKIYMSSIGG